MYFRSQKASKTQPLTSLSEDVKTMYSQAPKASSWGTCETAKHHVFQVPKGVKNPASNVTFWRLKDNVQSSTQSLVLGHLRNNPKAVKNFESLVLRHLRNGPGFSGARSIPQVPRPGCLCNSGRTVFWVSNFLASRLRFLDLLFARCLVPSSVRPLG